MHTYHSMSIIRYLLHVYIGLPPPPSRSIPSSVHSLRTVPAHVSANPTFLQEIWDRGLTKLSVDSVNFDYPLGPSKAYAIRVWIVFLVEYIFSDPCLRAHVWLNNLKTMRIAYLKGIELFGHIWGLSRGCNHAGQPSSQLDFLGSERCLQ